MKKLSHDEFITRVKAFNLVYDLSEVKYINYGTKVIVTCKVHGRKEVSPQSLLEGRDCQKCAAVKRWEAKLISVSDAITKAKELHGDKYDFSKATFRVLKDKWILTCSKHGDFRPTVEATLKGKGCFKCAGERKGIARRVSQHEAIRRAKEASPELDFSKAVYITALTKWDVYCNVHGKIEQLPSGSWQGFGCKKCSHAGINLGTLEEFMARLKTVHGDKYSVISETFTGTSKPLTMVCHKHGPWDTFGHRIVSNKVGCAACIHSSVPKLVYFFMLKTETGFGVKIGITKDIPSRKHCLTYDIGYRPLLIGHILFDDGGHAYKLEQFLLTQTGDKEVIPLLNNKNTEETRKFASMEDFKETIGSLVSEWKTTYKFYKTMDEIWYI